MNLTCEIQSEMDAYWKEHRHCTHVERHIGIDSDTMKWLDSQLMQYPWFESRYNVLSFAVKGIYEPLRCAACGKVMRIDNAREGKKYCSLKCASSSKEVQGKRVSTLQERYGCDSIMSCEKFKKMQNATMLQKYGSKYTMTSKVLDEKRRNTIMEKYGVDHYAKTDEFKEKIKTTCLERYGVDHYAKTDEFREASSKLNRHRSYELLSRWKDYVIPLFSEEEYEGMQYHQRSYKWRCVKCGLEFETESVNTGFHRELGGGYLPRCPHCFPIVGGISVIEKEVVEFVKSIYTGAILENVRDVLEERNELDIYLPDLKIAIEFDGLHWHSEGHIDPMYHLQKTEKCESLGINLIHVFEDEWMGKQEIVKDRIKSILGLEKNKIYARKCELKEIDFKVSNEFLESNHLQGGDNASIRYGLFYEGELVSVMTFGKPRFNKNYNWELIRFASKLGVQVIGGASKLLKHFINNHQGTIVSYADRRYSIGNLYKAIGFSFKEKTNPNYWWCKYKKKLSRYQCQKHRLKDLLGDKYNPDWTEDQNMINADYDKVYDCGNLVYQYVGDEK